MATAASPSLQLFWPMATPAWSSTSLFSPSAMPQVPMLPPEPYTSLPLPSAIPHCALASTVFWLPMAKE